MAAGEIYFGMPNPDDNFVADFQTENFDSCLFELYLFACFREQGATVSQDYDSPDFLIARAGHQCSSRIGRAARKAASDGNPLPDGQPRRRWNARVRREQRRSLPGEIVRVSR